MSKELVFIDGKEVKTDSLTIAEMFKKRHDNVLRDIENQIDMAGKDFSLLNFEETHYQHPQNKQWYPKITLTEEAFTLVVFSYNTKEAVQTKIKFLQEFKRMKDFIQNQSPEPLELALQAALKHEQELKVIKTDVDYLKGNMRVDSLQQQAIQEEAKKSIIQALGGIESLAYQQMSKKVFSAFWREFKKYFKVPRYGDIPKVKQEEAIRFIQLWRPSTTLQMEIDSCNSQMSF